MTAPDDYSAFFIGGRWVAPRGSDTLTVTSPYSGEAIAREFEKYLRRRER